MNEVILLVSSLSPLLAFVGTFVTIYISIKNAQSTRKAALLTAYVNGKLEHIKNLKSYLQEFLNEYISNSNKNQVALTIIKSKIDTSVLGSEEIYEEFDDYLDYCIANEYSKEIYNKLMEYGEAFVEEQWEKIKLETGIDLGGNSGLLKKLNDNTLGLLMNPKKLKKLKKKAKKKGKN